MKLIVSSFKKFNNSFNFQVVYVSKRFSKKSLGLLIHQKVFGITIFAQNFKNLRTYPYVQLI